MRTHVSTKVGVAVAGAAATGILAPASAVVTTPETLVPGLDHPRGVATGPRGRVAFSVADGSVWQVLRKGVDAGKVVLLTRTRKESVAPALDFNGSGKMFILTAGAASGKLEPGAGVLYGWHPGPGRTWMANIARYQRKDPDPYNVEGRRTESNPYGVAGLSGGGALVADAAGNDLLRVSPTGKVTTVARILPRTVRVPRGLGKAAPRAGTWVRSEAVPTSVVVGADGYWYVGELRGFPATPGKSEIWRIKPGTRNAVCRPRHPRSGPCRRYADGFTSIVDLDANGQGGLYVTELSKQGWLKLELGKAGSGTGALLYLARRGARPVELVPNQLTTPGGAAERFGHLFVTNGSLSTSGSLIRVQ
ncbi:MAG: ScyD/ScyE family protein [Nocardioidaceae bacterium]